MSDIQNDKDFTKKREAIKDIQAPLRDQIDKKLLEKLRDERFGAKLADMFRRGNNDRTEWLKRRQVFLSDWDNFVPDNGPVQSGSTGGLSNLHIPTSFTVIKTYHARLLQALNVVDPRPSARRPDSMEREQMVGDVMRYTEKSYGNHYEGFDKTKDTWVWHYVSDGVGTLKARWERKYEKFVDVVMEPRIETEFIVTPDGEVPSTNIVEEEVEKERVITCFDGPVATFVNEEDILITGGDGDPQEADMVQEQAMLTGSDLWSLVDQGIFDAAAVKKIIEGGPDSEYTDQTGDIKQDRVQKGGVSVLETDIDHDRYKILENYVRKCVDKSGVNSEIVVWSHLKSGEILRATYLRRINKDGKRPYFRAEFHRRHGSNYPMGLVEILYPISKEMDALHNMRIDAGLIATLPFGFYRASSSLDPKVIRYSPGSLIPVDDPTRDVFFPNLGNRTSFFIQEEQVLQTMVERLTGISDLSLGVLSGNQGATRTATGARALVGQANANLDVHLKRLFRAQRQFLRYLLHMLQQRIPEGLSFRVTGEDGQDYWRQVRSREDLAGDFDFEMDPTSADSDPQVRQEKAQQILNLSMNPVAIQLGSVGPRQVFEAMKNYLQAFGVKDWSRYLIMPPADSLTLTPAEEANRVLRGIEVPVTMAGDHQGFIDYFNYLISKPELLGSFSQEEVQSLAAHNQKHMQMLQAMEQMQAQASNLSQMRSNADQSVLQAPAGGNPMGGGQLIA